MLKNIALVAAAATVSGEVYFKETFDATWADRWASSGDGKFAVATGDHYGDAEADKGLKTTQDAKFYHMSAAVAKDFSNKDKDFVVSFSVQHGQKIDCGGGYLKLLKPGFEQSTFNGDTDYNIMFGPDICGSSTKKVHVILNYKGKNVEMKDTIACETDALTHFYTLLVKPDNTYEVFVDGKSKKAGSLEEDFDFLPPKLINDPDESKPTDWVDDAMMDDPEDVKPEGYDLIEKQLADPDASMPDDWDEEDDGEWEAPMIDNPEYKGAWSATRIENPDYKGSWVHPQIVNPEYADDKEIYAFDAFAGVGVDVWQVKSGSVFDNIIMTDSLEEADAFRNEVSTQEAEKKMFDAAKEAKDATDKAEREAADAARAAEEDEEDEDDEEEASGKEEL